MAEASPSSAKTLYAPDYEAIVALVRAARQEAGLTQAELAARLGRPQAYVSRVETGERRLDVAEWLRWLRAAGADPVTFLVRLAAQEGIYDPPLTLSLSEAGRAARRRRKPKNPL